jgi:hypothetical protein
VPSAGAKRDALIKPTTPEGVELTEDEMKSVSGRGFWVDNAQNLALDGIEGESTTKNHPTKI